MDRDVEILFHELADAPEAERARRLRAAPEAVRVEVESLLRFDGLDDDGLTVQVAAGAEQALASGAPARCGPYRLGPLLGRGGMGSVYLAERDDGEIEQRVAVKLLRFGGDDPAARDHFLRERQILATLTHPGIARLLDAGHTGQGQPYLVMEHVDGRPIDEHAAGLPLTAKLRLLLRVCDAVSYAHRNLVLHRDLKPSNILVDASGEPKLLDFGIARMLDGSAQTQTVERRLTPGYASPEQALGKPQGTATDVYSLGAVLYRLLTGRSAHEHAGGRLAEIPPPSRLNPAVPKDLDCIVAMALREDPEDRYSSIDAFADDIRAFLEGSAVRARSGNSLYRTRKFVRRYWAGTAAAALVFASLAAGLYIANRQRAIAQERFQDLRALSNRIFDFDRAIADLPGSAPARRQLVEASLQYLERLGAQSRGDLDLSQEIAEGYWHVAHVQGVPTDLNLGLFKEAEASLVKAESFLAPVLAARPHSVSALLRAGSIAHDRMILAESLRRREDALRYARRASELLDRLIAEPRASDQDRAAAAGAMGNIALAYNNLHLYADAAQRASRAAEVLRPIAGSQVRLGAALSLLANARRYQGDLDGALRAAREATQLEEHAVYPNETNRMINLYGVLMREGMILGENEGVSLDRPAEAIAAFREAYELTADAVDKNPGDYASRSRFGTAALNWANVLRHSDPAKALTIYDAALRRLDEIPGNVRARRDASLLLANSSYALDSLHREADAAARVDSALRTLCATVDCSAAAVELDSNLYSALVAQADHEAAAGRRARGGKLYDGILDRVLAARPDWRNDLRDANRLAGLYSRMAANRRALGDANGGAAMESRREELWTVWDRKLPRNSFIARQLGRR